MGGHQLISLFVRFVVFLYFYRGYLTKFWFIFHTFSIASHLLLNDGWMGDWLAGYIGLPLWLLILNFSVCWVLCEWLHLTSKWWPQMMIKMLLLFLFNLSGPGWQLNALTWHILLVLFYYCCCFMSSYNTLSNSDSDGSCVLRSQRRICRCFFILIFAFYIITNLKDKRCCTNICMYIYTNTIY